MPESSTTRPVTVPLCRLFLFLFGNKVIAGRLLHGVFPGFGITAGNCQYMPVLIVNLQEITPVVIARPAGFFAEKGVLDYGF